MAIPDGPAPGNTVLGSLVRERVLPHFVAMRLARRREESGSSIGGEVATVAAELAL